MISHSEQDTVKIAEEMASKTQPPMVITLNGDLGAGKSSFARAFIRAKGIDGAIPSPTFSLVNLYQTESAQLAHMDLYRLEDDEEAYQAGIEEILHDPYTISLVEWPERLSWMLPKKILQVNIKHINETTREFSFEEIES